MGELVMIIAAVVSIIINAVLAQKVSEAAQMKGYDSVTLLCFICGPAAYLYVVALPDLKIRQQNEEMIKALKELGEQNETLIRVSKSGSAPAAPKYSKNELPDL